MSEIEDSYNELHANYTKLYNLYLPLKKKEDNENKAQILIKKIDNKIFRAYIITGIVFISVLVTYVVIFAYKNIIALVLFSLLAVPLSIFMTIYTIGRLYSHRKKIKEAVITKFTRRYIVTKFFTENRQIEKQIYLLSGNDFTYDGGLYIIDARDVFLNEDGIPEIHFKKGIPNSLHYNFNKYVERYNKAEIKAGVTDDWNNILDISYSSGALQKFKGDKILFELHSDRGVLSNWGMAIMGLIIIVILAIIGFKVYSG